MADLFRNLIFAIMLMSLVPSALAGVAYISEYNGGGDAVSFPYNLSRPVGLAIHNGNLYVSDWRYEGVFIIDENDNVVNSVGIIGTTAAKTSRPNKMLSYGNYVYISDKGNGKVFRYDPKFRVLEGSWLNLLGDIKPVAVQIDNSSIYVLDYAGSKVFEYRSDNYQLKKQWLSEGVGDMQLKNPQDIEITKDRIYIVDTGNNRLQIYDRDWNYIESWGTGKYGIEFSLPTAVDVYENKVFVADSLNSRIMVFGLDGFPLFTINSTERLIGNGSSENISLNRPADVIVEDGFVYVADRMNGRVVKYILTDEKDVPMIHDKLDQAQEDYELVDSYRKILIDEGLQVRTWSIPERLYAAWSSYNQSKYGDANKLVEGVLKELVTDKLETKQALREHLIGKLDTLKKSIRQYNESTLSQGLEKQLQIIKNRQKDAEEKIETGDFGPAAKLLDKISEDMKVFSTQVEEYVQESGIKSPKVESTESSSERASLVGFAYSLDERLLKLKISKAQRNQPDEDYSIIEGLIKEGTALARESEFEKANSTLSAAEILVKTNEDMWWPMAQKIDMALMKIKEAKDILRKSETWKALGTDIGDIEKKVGKAEELVYTEPDEAFSLASEAIGQAEEQMQKGEVRGLAAGWMVSAILGVVLVGGLAYMLYTNRLPYKKRKGL